MTNDPLDPDNILSELIEDLDLLGKTVQATDDILTPEQSEIYGPKAALFRQELTKFSRFLSDLRAGREHDEEESGVSWNNPQMGGVQ